MAGKGPASGIKATPTKRRNDHGTGRQCAMLGCPVKLSRYNPGEFCGIHTPPDYRPSR
jgi:hypothetical protein